jgi:hypothetical protein
VLVHSGQWGASNSKLASPKQLDASFHLAQYCSRLVKLTVANGFFHATLNADDMCRRPVALAGENYSENIHVSQILVMVSLK